MGGSARKRRVSFHVDNNQLAVAALQPFAITYPATVAKSEDQPSAGDDLVVTCVTKAQAFKRQRLPSAVKIATN